MKPLYKRFVLKLSGEALQGEQKFGINSEAIISIAKEIKDVWQLGCEIGIVLGAGNIYRGNTRDRKIIDPVTADYMGMLATVINGLALQNTLEKLGLETRVQSAFDMKQFCEMYIRRRAIRHLEKKRVVIFAAGTGNPFFSTDTTAALRAAEIDAEVILLAKTVDGVYDSDPASNPNAHKFDRLDYLDVLRLGLKVMDSTATSLCMDNGIPIIVFGLESSDNIKKVVLGEKIGTSIGDNF